MDDQTFADSKTVISELTEMDMSDSSAGSGSASFSCETIQKVLSEELNKLCANDLKEKCKVCGLVGTSKLKKPELVQLLEQQFNKIATLLDGLSKNDLKQLAKVCNVKRITGTGVTKPYLLHHILLFRAGNLLFTEPNISPETASISTTTTTTTTTASANSVKELSREPDTGKEKEKEPDGAGAVDISKNGLAASSLEELTRQKQWIEEQIATAKEEERKRKLEEEAARVAAAEEERRRKMEQEEEERKEREKEQARKKKQSIPKNVRTIVWNHYIGSDIIKHKCLCCKKVAISNTSFEVGHVISEKNGGTHQIDNLRPICFACNHSMGTENMVDFVVKYGLFIG